MKLQNAQDAVITRAKIVDYLLSERHFHGRHKAAFFRQFGFRSESWQTLADSLKKHATDHEIAREEPSPFGQRFVIEGIMEMPDGRMPLVRTIWFLRSGEDMPRFVTAYPLKRSNAENDE
jgi:hypothetical protein